MDIGFQDVANGVYLKPTLDKIMPKWAIISGILGREGHRFAFG
jgi:hypothetical protein